MVSETSKIKSKNLFRQHLLIPLPILIKMRFKYLLILLILLIPTISAIEISLSKTNYNPQETLQAEITGNFISFISENILIYKGDAVHSTPTISDLTKQGNTYYFYSLLPTQEGNYTLKIENSKYTESGKTTTETITKDFTINRTGESVLSINPGFIITSEDFSIKLKSLNNNQEVLAELESTNDFKNLSLTQDSEQTLSFSISTEKSLITNLKINDYNIPVFILKKTEIINNTNQTNQSEIDPTDPDVPKINIENKTEEEIGELYCVDIGYKCEENEKCEGEIVSSLDGSCCVGECIEEKQTNYGWIIGIVLLVIVGALIWFFYSKYGKRQAPKSTEDILKDKSDSFGDRMKGTQVTGNVTRS